jgi:hypothetical protein
MMLVKFGTVLVVVEPPEPEGAAPSFWTKKSGVFALKCQKGETFAVVP